MTTQNELRIRFEAVKEAAARLMQEIEDAEQMAIVEARPLGDPAPTCSGPEARRGAWLAELARRGCYVSNALLDFMEETFQQGWAGCYARTRGESSHERADQEAEAAIPR